MRAVVGENIDSGDGKYVPPTELIWLNVAEIGILVIVLIQEVLFNVSILFYILETRNNLETRYNLE